MTASAAAPDVTAPDPWRWESSLGLEVLVPSAWSINDIGCGMSAAPTVARAIGASRLCLTPEPTNKQVIELVGYGEGDADAPPEGLKARAVMLGTEPAERAEGRAKDGRFLGWLRIPRLRALVTMRVLDRATVQHVLDSARVVEVDHNGCSARHEQMRPQPPAATQALVPSDTSTLVLCYYGEADYDDQADVLGASTALAGDDALHIAQLLNAASPHGNADVDPDECLRPEDPPAPDLVLIASSSADRAVVQLRFSGCTDRGFYNGRSDAQITESTLLELMKPIHTGFGFSALPP